MWPSYLGLIDSGEFGSRAAALRELLAPCRLCPRECAVDRLRGELGFCRSGATAMVSSHGPHFGEERPLVGVAGSGTIFLTNCNLRCVFCQNAEISQLGHGREVSADTLARMMLELQAMGCHNINFVTPTHYAPQLVEGIGVAAAKELRVPVVWNCGGYESVEVLGLLDGIVDIYMPDAKYADAGPAGELSSAPDYPEKMAAALREMHRQVGNLELDARGVARRGLLVRHLVLPNDLAGTMRLMQLIASLSSDTYVNVMAQYRPCFHALRHDGVARRPTREEHDAAVQAARDAGLHRLDER